VARQAGVSYQTVSRVVNEDPHVAELTRARVMQAIHQLNYQPNFAARSLVTRRSHILEVITFGSTHYGPAQMVAHVESAGRRRGYNLMLSNISEMTVEAIRAAIDNLSRRLVDGIILIAPVIGVSYDELVRLCSGIPFVMIDTELGEHTPSVVIDQEYGSRLVTQHLIDLGHRQQCAISGPLTWFGARARHRSWQATLAAAGLTPGPNLESDWTAAGGYHAAHRLIESGAGFSGLVVGNDQMALGAMRALHERGLRIPDDVSVVGFDDVPESMCYEPPLTTVRQDFETLGTMSVEYLVERIDDPECAVQQRVIYPTLIVRQSSGRAALVQDVPAG
jgi:LacI family transcriptional regulator